MITVFGSINVDLVCRVRASPRPGETVHGSDYALIPGGKGANQALAARRAGAAVRMVGAIGDDDIGKVALRRAHRRPASISTAVARRPAPPASPSSPSTTAARTPSSSRPAPMPRPMPGRFRDGALRRRRHAPPPDGSAARRDLRRRAAGPRRRRPRDPVGRALRAALAGASSPPSTSSSSTSTRRRTSPGTSASPAATPRRPSRRLPRALGRTVIATLGPDGAVAAGGEGVDPGAGA